MGKAKEIVHYAGVGGGAGAKRMCSSAYYSGKRQIRDGNSTQKRAGKAKKLQSRQPQVQMVVDDTDDRAVSQGSARRAMSSSGSCQLQTFI